MKGSLVRSGERSAARTVAVNNAVRRTESLLKSPLAKLPEHAVAAAPNPAPANARSQSVASTPGQPAQNTVITDPYPSIRIPPDISSQKATRGSSLQIGRATSRVEPVYPEEAKRQGVEGTVKLHVVVGRDGTVQSAEPISGPSLLAKAATSVIREWHYAQTLLAGQPVETEQDIVVNFRLVNPPASKN